MAIIIPSRNIYEKDNDKIRDNKIDRIEVGAFEILPNNEYDVSVANETITNMLTGSSYIDEGFTISYATKTNPNPESNADYQYFATLLVGYQNITAISKKIRIYVSKKQKQTSIISKLKKLVEDVTQDDGTKKTIPKINFSVVANKYIGKGQILAEIPDRFSEFHDDNVHVLERYERDFSNSTPTQTKVDIVELKIDINRTAGGKEFPIVTQNFGWICGEEIPARENGTISATITSEDENGYTIETEILCGAYLDNYYSGVTSGGYFQDEHTFELDQHLEGECIWYEPISIEFTLYGNTIGIDLNDNTVIVGDEKGDNIFSIEGNELLQTSNYIDKQTELKKDVDYTLKTESLGLNNYKHIFTFVKTPSSNIDIIFLKNGEEVRRRTSLAGYKTFEYIYNPTLYDEIKVVLLHTNSIEESYKNTIIQYENGKETATIRCAIADYSNGVVAFLQSYARQGNSISATFAIRDNNIPNLSYGEYVKVNELVGYVNRPYSNGTIGVLFENLDSIYQAFEKHKEYAIVKFGDEAVSPYSQGKMIFSQYDEVIPMVYGANGQDKPLSKKQDGSPKEFVVLSSRVFYDGAVWQELILQEK